MHKVNNNTLPQSYNSFFQKITKTHSHFTRSAASQNYFIPGIGSSIGKRNLANEGAVGWSDIPQDFKSFSYVRVCKSYKKFLVAHYST